MSGFFIFNTMAEKRSDKKRGLTYLIFSLVVLILIVIFRPVPIIEESEALVYKGEISRIYESGQKDVSLEMKNGMHFYINQGLEKGLVLDSLVTKYEGKMVEVKYPDYWTLLDAKNEHKHLSKLSFNGEVIYSEFEKDQKD